MLRLPDTGRSAAFKSDTLLCGSWVPTFIVIDNRSRAAMHVEVDTSISAKRLIQIFERLRTERGMAQVLRTDHSPELAGEAFTNWTMQASMLLQHIQPNKPCQSAFIERFHRATHDQVLDPNLFTTLDDVRQAVRCWMIKYDENRPHDALDDRTPEHARLRLQFVGKSPHSLSPLSASLRVT